MLTEDDRQFFLSMAVPKERKFLGFKVQEIIIISTVIISIVTFYVRTDDAMKRLITATDWLTTFARNSDGYHGSTLGVQFEQGRPVK